MGDVTRRRYLISSALTLALAGCASDEVNEPTETPSPSDLVNAWLDEHQSQQREAVEHFNKGTDAFEAEDYSRAMMHLERSEKQFTSLQEAAQEEANEYENGTRTAELFGLVVQYFWAMKEAAAWRYSAAYELKVNGDPVASEKALERSRIRFDKAEDLKRRLREELKTPESG